MADQPRRREPERDARTGRSAPHQRIAHQHQWVEQQLRIARERGDFDDLPGFGKPIESLGAEHDPDWWVKQLVEREQLSVPPPALQLRKDDAGLDGELDRLPNESAVRRAVDEFNQRVRQVLYSNPGGPPVVTRSRDVEEEVRRWRERLDARRRPPAPPPGAATTRRTRFWRRAR